MLFLNEKPKNVRYDRSKVLSAMWVQNELLDRRMVRATRITFNFLGEGFAERFEKIYFFWKEIRRNFGNFKTILGKFLREI